MGLWSPTARPPRQARNLTRGFENLELRAMLDATAGDPPEGESLGAVVPDFALVDVNPGSATYNQPISPRDYLAEATAWYFGHST